MAHAQHTGKISTCLICDSETNGTNYGALSCCSCKTFFRRHGHRAQTFRSCRYGGHCKIDFQTRKWCAPCRLAKCFTVGMSTDFIRKEFQYKKPQTPLKSGNREIDSTDSLHMALPQIQSLNLLCKDRSSLSAAEWRLLSNVIHAFDKFSVVRSIEHAIEQLIVTQPTINVDVSQSFDLFASFYTSVQAFITSSADFRILTLAEQRSLFQRNLHGLFNFAGTFMLRDGGTFDHSRNENLIIPLYGYDIVRQARLITKRLSHDSTLVKIMPIIFAFSTNCYTVNMEKDLGRDPLLTGGFRLLGSQNMYVEILWKYMLYRYSYKEAAVCFAGLVKHMLDLITLSTGIYMENVYHQQLVDKVVEEAKTALTPSAIDETPLWGKPAIDENNSMRSPSLMIMQ